MPAECSPFAASSVAQGYQDHLEPVIFRPWASRLLDFVGVDAGQAVLDVASGTGVVAREAARRAGPSGRVIASDISSGMLSHLHVGADPNGAPLTVLECSATELLLEDGSVDVVLCQQGLPFIPDRVRAVREMHRVLRSGGKAAVAVWRSTPRVEPFIVYGEVLRDLGVREPFPNAYDTTANSMQVDEVRAAFEAAGFIRVVVTTSDLDLEWPSVDEAVQACTGTPYGPTYAALDPVLREQAVAELTARMTGPDGRPTRHRMTAVMARGEAT